MISYISFLITHTSCTYVVTHVERRIQADANALTTMANPLTRRAWNCLAPFTEIYVHISLHDIIKKPGR